MAKLTKILQKELEEACSAGHLGPVESIATRVPFYSWKRDAVGSLMYIAAKNGHAEIVGWLVQQNSTNHLLTTEIFYEALVAAIDSSHVNVVIVLVREAGMYDDAVHYAIEKGNKIILSCLMSYHSNLAIMRAAENGSVEILRWMVTTFRAKPDVAFNNNEAIRRAAENGNLDVVRWLVEKSGQKVDVTAKNNLALCLAAENGHLAVVKWLVFESDKVVVIADQNNYALRKAAENGHLEVVKFLVKDSNQVCDVAVDDNIIIRQAAENGHLEVVRWLVEECEQEVNPTAVDNHAVKGAANQGHLEVVKYLVSGAHVARQAVASVTPSFKYSGWKVDATAGGNRAIRIAAENGYFDIVKWLIKESGQPVDITVDNDVVLRTVIERDRGRDDRLEIVKWIICESGQPVNIPALPYFTSSFYLSLADKVLEYLILIKSILEHTTLENIQRYPEMVEQIEKDPEQIEVYVHVNLKDDELQSIAESRYTPAFRRGGGAPKFRMLNTRI